MKFEARAIGKHGCENVLILNIQKWLNRQKLLGEVFMSSDPSPLSSTWQGLKCLAEVHAWESQNLPFIRTASGRELYFQIVDRLLDPGAEEHTQLKSFSMHLTDRIMRTRIQAFVALGLLTVGPNASDLRSRSIMPTAKLMGIFQAHREQLWRAVAKRCHCTGKQ